jgi:hypothetical protein
MQKLPGNQQKTSRTQIEKLKNSIKKAGQAKGKARV